MSATRKDGWPIVRSHRTPTTQSPWLNASEFFLLTGALALVSMATMAVRAYDMYLHEKPIGNVFFGALFVLMADVCLIALRIMREGAK